MFSTRSETPGEEHPLARLRAELVRAGRPILDWSHGNPTTADLAWPPREVVAAFGNEAWLRYEPAPLGLAHAREMVARHLRDEELDVTPSDVVLVASTSEAYASLFKILCDSGDNVLVPAPSYPLFDELARWEGVELRPYRLAFAGEWHLDLASVRAACNDRTRAILVVSPNNPTGSCLAASDLEALAAIGLPVLADEVFCKAPARDQHRTLSARSVLASAPHVVLDGLSKRLALPQVKLGWMLLGGPAAFRDELRARLEFALDAQLSLSAPVQHALPDLLARESEARHVLTERIRASEVAVREECAGSSISVLPREAGWSLVLRVPASDDARLAVRLLERHGVYTLPGSFFGFTQEGYLVVSLLVAPAAARRAARALIAILDDDDD